MTKNASHSSKSSGKLRIGDNWNAIRIIALSQTNPLKAVAEFVENSIDAKSKLITITRGKEEGLHFIRIKDDGEGIRKNEEGQPDFDYVATHICDSVKRRLKDEGATGLQGEFGIGLLSFWTVGEEMTITSSGADGRAYQMRMRKGDPGFHLTSRKVLLPEPGTELIIRNILPGIKNFSGEKIQWYLASELRDRIRHTGVEIKVIDRTARAEFKVEPRKFEGRLLHQINKSAKSDLYVELYFTEPSPANSIGLFRHGTRVIDNLAGVAEFSKPPWTSGYLQGIIDAPFLSITPGTRTGLVQDESYSRLCGELAQLEPELLELIEAQARAEEEQTSKEVLRSIQKALKEALLALPAEEYDWFDLHSENPRRGKSNSKKAPAAAGGFMILNEAPEPSPAAGEDPGQKQFFEFPGPLYTVRVSPASTVASVGAVKNLRAIARDRSNRQVNDGVTFQWTIVEGEGTLENARSEIVSYHAPAEPGLTEIKVSARQGGTECDANALVTVTQNLIPTGGGRNDHAQGIPSYTFEKAPGELWRSRFNSEQNVIVINNGHRDFVYAARNKALKLRYITRLFAKELVLKNFPGMDVSMVLERLIELCLYTEENLR